MDQFSGKIAKRIIHNKLRVSSSNASVFSSFTSLTRNLELRKNMGNTPRLFLLFYPNSGNMPYPSDGISQSFTRSSSRLTTFISLRCVEQQFCHYHQNCNNQRYIKKKINSSVSTLDGSTVLLMLTASYSFRLTCCLAILTQVEKIIVPYSELQRGAALITS